ncbi:MAG: AAA family ATPase [Cyclobacteriaceae bacterium]
MGDTRFNSKGDKNKHLTRFKVENFKRFESLEIKDLGQYNLIVGDNNVGKTSVLEALLIDDFALIPAINLFNILKLKYSFKDIKYRDLSFFCNRSKENEIRDISFQMNGVSFERRIHLMFDFQNKSVSIKDSRDELNQTAGFLAEGDASEIGIPYISPFYRDDDSNSANIYSEEIQRKPLLKQRFLEGIRIMIPDLENIEPYVPKDMPPNLIFTKSLDQVPLPLDLLGDGTVNLFRILVVIFSNRGGRVMIDEVDAGIYFNRLKEFWKVILQTATDNDVQLFMTTHNEECIKYFKEVLEDDLPELKKDVRSITLVENTKTKIVTAHTYDFEQFEHAINIGNEVRA